MTLFSNACKFSNCGLEFQNLLNLIKHIEEKHINHDPRFVLELERRRPQALPMSYVLPFFTNNQTTLVEKVPLKLNDSLSSNKVLVVSREPIIKKTEVSVMTVPSTTFSSIYSTPPSSICTSSPSSSSSSSSCEETSPVRTPVVSEDSWTSVEEYTSDFILKGAVRVYKKSLACNANLEKPYICPVPGCKKKYKNYNGIRYHAKKGHKNLLKCVKISNNSYNANNSYAEINGPIS